MTTSIEGQVLNERGRPLDRISLAGLTATGHHGVFPHERLDGQPFGADVVMYLDTQPAAGTDDLTRTVDYGAVAVDVVAVLSGAPVDLIETVAERIAATVLARPEVVAVDVTVHKPQAPLEVAFTDIAVSIRRDRVRAVPVVAATTRTALDDAPEPLAGSPVESFGAPTPAVPVPLPERAPSPEAVPLPEPMTIAAEPLGPPVPVELPPAVAQVLPPVVDFPPAADSASAEAPAGAYQVADRDDSIGTTDPEAGSGAVPMASSLPPGSEPIVVGGASAEPLAPAPAVMPPSIPPTGTGDRWPVAEPVSDAAQPVDSASADVAPESDHADVAPESDHSAEQVPESAHGAEPVSEQEAPYVPEQGPGLAGVPEVPYEPIAFAPGVAGDIDQADVVTGQAATVADGGHATPVPDAASPHDRMDDIPAEPVTVVLALGANLGDAQQTLRDAVQDLDRMTGLEITEVSPLARSAAEGGPEDQPDYLNAVLIARTTLSARALLHACQAVESAHGRVREVHWGPRTLDIDLITYGSLTDVTADLELPHPRAHERAFVLEPWVQVDPDAVLPGLGGGPVAALAATAPDREGIRWLALDWLTEPAPTSGAVPEAAQSTATAPEQPPTAVPVFGVPAGPQDPSVAPAPVAPAPVTPVPVGGPSFTSPSDNEHVFVQPDTDHPVLSPQSTLLAYDPFEANRTPAQPPVQGPLASVPAPAPQSAGQPPAPPAPTYPAAADVFPANSSSFAPPGSQVTGPPVFQPPGQPTGAPPADRPLVAPSPFAPPATSPFGPVHPVTPADQESNEPPAAPTFPAGPQH